MQGNPILPAFISWPVADTATLLMGLVIIAVAVIACVRRVDVRLALLLAALALGVLSGLRDVLKESTPSALAWSALAQPPMAILQVFLRTLADEKFVVPICCAMGFAHVLRHTQCDQHLVQLLVRPLRRVRGLLIPGTVVVGFLVNIPVISQTSTAVTIGCVLVPLLRAANISPVTAGSALLLGSSIGGELLNPGAPELNTIAQTLNIPATDIVAKVLPLNLLQLGVATSVFWWLCVRGESRAGNNDMSSPTRADTANCENGNAPPFRVNPIKASIPLLPLAILFLTGPPFKLVDVNKGWLVNVASPDELARFNSRLIGAAMLLGAAAAALTTPSAWRDTARVFFEGAGYAFTHIIALIVVASCFGKGVEQIGLAAVIGEMIRLKPALLLPAAGLLPMSFAALCGSGMASTQSLYKFFAEPSTQLGIDPILTGAIVSLGSAAGRTMSPVAAVTLMAAALTGSNPVDLARRVVVPLLVGMTAVVICAMILTEVL
jgi:DcuC family C4-dicarboxylate transporter